MIDAAARLLDVLYRGAIEAAELKHALEIVEDVPCRGGALVALDHQVPAANLAAIPGIFDEYGKL